MSSSHTEVQLLECLERLFRPTSRNVPGESCTKIICFTVTDTVISTAFGVKKQTLGLADMANAVSGAPKRPKEQPSEQAEK